MATTAVRTNPYPGLRPFNADEDHLFFGRDKQITTLLKRLRKSRFVAVVGYSGSGKSSLVRAGLIPALHTGSMVGAGSHWRIALLRPGGNPIRHLARALHSKEAFGVMHEEDRELEETFTETTLRRSTLGFVELAQQMQMKEEEKLFVVVDQFEELFRYERVAGFRDDATAFVKLLLEAAKGVQPIYVMLTMRSDFLGDCARFRNLPEAINEGQYLVPRLTRRQQEEAIKGPAAVGGGAVAGRLVQRLLNDVGDNPDQLPVLQHALMRTWDLWEKQGRMTEELDGEYEAIGEMHSALSMHAEEALTELPDDRGRHVAEILFKCVTEKGSDNREIRRPTSIDDIASVAGATVEQVIAVVENFRKTERSFLMPPADVVLHKGSVIDISHESLIRNWSRLRDWVDEESRSANMYVRLAQTAQLHARNQAALWRDPDLALALQWRNDAAPNEEWARRYHPGFTAAAAFLEESETQQRRADAARLADREREKEQIQALAEEQKRRADEQAAAAARQRRISVFAAVLAALSLFAALWAGRAERDAERSRIAALASADTARISAQTQEGLRQIAESLAVDARRLAAVADSTRLAESEARRVAERTSDELQRAMFLVGRYLRQESREGEAAAQDTVALTERQRIELTQLLFRGYQSESQDSENIITDIVERVFGLTTPQIDLARRRAAKSSPNR